MATHGATTHQTGREEPESRALRRVEPPGPQISVVPDADGDGFVSLGALAASLVQRLALKRAEEMRTPRSKRGGVRLDRDAIAGGVGLATSNSE